MGLKTEIEVAALIRRAHSGGAFAAVVVRGDADFGSLVVKVSTLDGRARLYAPALGPDGARRWIDPLGAEGASPEPQVDAYLVRARDRDPDLWIVEIEDKLGRSFIV